jgi:uncharacterized membrane protein
MFLQLMIYVTLYFDIPIARQVLGFFYFTFIPGLIILKLFRLNELDILETILFSAGLSVALLMIVGLLINDFGLLFGVSKPLSLVPLIIVLNSLILACSVLVYLKSENMKISSNEPTKMVPFALLFLFLPILSIFGAMYVNAYENNLLLLFMIIVISLIFVMSILSKKLFSLKLYPLAVLMIAFSLLFHATLVSNYLYIGDIHLEYFVFKCTKENAYWSSLFIDPRDITYGRLNSMLSVTILPTIYSVILNMDASWVFKLLYPSIFSLVPLALYKLWRKEIEARKAFIAAFLFMAFNVFYTEMLGLNRQMIAELFFSLLLLVIFNKNMKFFNKMVCFMIFSIVLITSHYSLAEIFLFFMSASFILLTILKHQSRNVTASMIIFFSVSMFAWYIHTSSSAVFESFLTFGDYVLRQLGDFFNPASRGSYVIMGLGLEPPPSIWNAIGRAFAYMTEALIAIGFLGMLLKRVKMSFDRDYFILCVIAMAFLTALILIPGLANTLNMTRFYHILLFFLAPLCVIGAEVIADLVSKRKREIYTSILLLVVLVPYFLFQTGFVYEVTRVQSWSVPLSKYRMDGLVLFRSFAYVNGWKYYGASWLFRNVDVLNVNVYVDTSSHELGDHGLLRYPQVLSNTTKSPPNGVVYLSYLNTIEGIVATSTYLFNSSELSYINEITKVYDNGGVEIFSSNG